MSELVATDAATTVARGVAKGVLYFNAWWRGDPAVAVDVAANSDPALFWHYQLDTLGIYEERQGYKHRFNTVDAIIGVWSC